LTPQTRHLIDEEKLKLMKKTACLINTSRGPVVDEKALYKILKESDFVTLHVPLTPQTRHLIDEEKLKLMKKTACLINTSRGPVVDEKALYKALKEGWIWAAGLDVWEKEPTDPNNPLLTLDNVTVSPHIASASYETRLKMAMMAVENMTAILEGRVPPNLVNKEVLKVRPPKKE
ncbi:hypothetical protein J7L29_07980, partial [Candidatus Bathyarchaeota archaeon]|nr:hypothetical protein [Candidatus Bathyarchaeota archaeon]